MITIPVIHVMLVIVGMSFRMESPSDVMEPMSQKYQDIGSVRAS
jgi:hypothetical protein